MFERAWGLMYHVIFLLFYLLGGRVHNDFLAELWCAKRACGAPWLSKSTHPRKLGNHVTVHRPPVRPHHRKTNVQSHTFSLVWEHRKTYIAHQCCDQLAAVRTGYLLTISPDRITGSGVDPSRSSILLQLSFNRSTLALVKSENRLAV